MARSAVAYADEFFELPARHVGSNIVWMPAERRPEGKSERPYTAASPASRGTIAAVEEPRWLVPTVCALTRVLDLPNGWDSYGAPRIQRRAVNTVLELLGAAAQYDSPVPIVVPTTDGGVQLEWHAWGLDVELDVSPGEAPQLFFRDRRSNEIQEEQLTSNLAPLSQALKVLTERAAQEAGR